MSALLRFSLPSSVLISMVLIEEGIEQEEGRVRLPRLWADAGFLDSVSERRFLLEEAVSQSARARRMPATPAGSSFARPSSSNPAYRHNGLGSAAGSFIFRDGINANLGGSGSAPTTPARSLTPAPGPPLKHSSARPQMLMKRSTTKDLSALLKKGLNTTGQQPELTKPATSALGTLVSTTDQKPPPSISTYAPKWWVPDAIETKAIEEFDQRHRQHLLRANRVRDHLRVDPTSLSRTQALDVAIWELGANRYFERHALGGVRTYAQKKKAKKKKIWKILESIWVPRRKNSPGNDFYDTAETKGKAFATDWVMACERMKLENKVERAAAKLEHKEDAPLIALQDAMVEYADVIMQTFTFYASLGAGNDIFGIGKNSFLQFVRDLDLVDNEVMGQRDQDIQLIFEAANASASKEEQYNHRLSLNRWEFTGVLVQLLLGKKVVTQMMPIAEAVAQFFDKDLVSNVPRECFQDSNSFRSDFCYIEETDIVLKQYEASLRFLFNAFAFGTGAIGDKLLSTKLLDFTEYILFINRLDIIDPFITMREVRLVFLWSRMLIIDENVTAGRKKVIQLNFEDFLEVLVRFAYMMALPNDQDIFDLGVEHAGEYLEWLDGHPDEEKAFKEARTRNIGQKLDQPIGHKLRHFIEWMLYTVRGGEPKETSGPASITKRDAEKFQRGMVAPVRKNIVRNEEESDMDSPGRSPHPLEGDDEVGYMIDKNSAAAQLDQDSDLRSRMRLDGEAE